MQTIYSTLAMVVVSMTCAAAPGRGVQERIPELQRNGARLKDSVTLTGCVTRGTEPGTFTLTNVPKAGDRARDVARPLTVVLSATDVDISKHVDHMVSVKGSHAFEVSAIGTTGSERQPPPDARKESDKKTPPTFTIKALKMVADSCAQPAR